MNKSTTYIENDSAIAEVIYNPNREPAFQFVVYDKHNGSYNYSTEVDNICIDDVIRQKKLVESGTVLLPSAVNEYDDTGCLFREIKAFIHDYLDIDGRYESLAACYVLLSCVYDDFNRLPYLRVIGEAGSGKTRFLEVIGDICYRRTSITGAASTSSLFRIIDAFHGTLVIDEADVKDSSPMSDIIKILTCGYKKGSPVVRVAAKCIKKSTEFELETYETYGPKIIATRKRFCDEGIESRCLTIEMYKPMNRRIPIILPEKFWLRSSEIRNKLLLFRLKNKGHIQLDEEFNDIALDPRLIEIMLPIIRLSPTDEERSIILNLLTDYNTTLINHRQGDDSAEVVAIILELKKEKSDKIYIKTITDKYNANKEDKDHISNRKMGHIIRNNLQVNLARAHDGTYLKANDDKIHYWAKRCGMDDGNEVITGEIKGVTDGPFV